MRSAGLGLSAGRFGRGNVYNTQNVSLCLLILGSYFLLFLSFLIFHIDVDVYDPLIRYFMLIFEIYSVWLVAACMSADRLAGAGSRGFEYENIRATGFGQFARLRPKSWSHVTRWSDTHVCACPEPFPQGRFSET